MIVVTNSTCLIGLAKISKLEILKALFGEIYIPCVVYKEVVEKGEGRAGALEVRQADWIVKQEVKDRFRISNELYQKILIE